MKISATLGLAIALVACRQEARQPVDAELRLTGGDDLLRDDVRAAVLQRHVEPGRLVEALQARRVVAGELRLRNPLELQGDLRQLRALVRSRRRARHRRDRDEGESCQDPPLPHPPTPFFIGTRVADHAILHLSRSNYESLAAGAQRTTTRSARATAP